MPDQTSYDEFLTGRAEDREEEKEDARVEAEREKRVAAVTSPPGGKDEKPHP